MSKSTSASSVNGDDLSGMSISESPSTVGGTPMDVDMVWIHQFYKKAIISPGLTLFLQVIGSPSMSPANLWRYTPPPTTSAVRSNKRKRMSRRHSLDHIRLTLVFVVDDRYDPYATASKRRAVSPSLHHLHTHHGSPKSRGGHPHVRPPVSIPVPVIPSVANSACSSPTLGRPMSMASSPTMRATMGLGSPIMRPLPRPNMRFNDGEDREIDGTGEAVGGLSLG
jgi:hypothetical protein